MIAGTYTLVALGLQLNVGYTGIVNFGQAAFMAVGAYTMAILVLKAGFSFWLSLPIAVLVAMLFGVIVGLPSLRLRADYFAIATIAMAEVVRLFAQNARGLTGGNLGLFCDEDDPSRCYPDAWRDVSESINDNVVANFWSDPDSLFPLLLVIWLTVGIATIALSYFQGTPWGRVLRAIREDEDAALALGKNTLLFKLQSLAISACLGAIAGFFLALNLATIHPIDFEPLVTFFAFSVLILGGLASYRGVAVGAVLFWFVLEGTRFIDLPDPPFTETRIAALRLAITGAAADRPDGLPAPGDSSASVRRWSLVSDGRALLEVEDVVKRFGGIRAVDGATMRVREGAITALIGPNGAGKTTLFNVVTGFYRGERGSVTFEGNQVFGDAPYEIARKGMVRTFQITKALAAMPVIDNMMLAAPDQPGERFRNLILRPGAVREREKEVRAQAMEVLEIFDLTELADDYAGTLSGGQRKLLELARALMARPKLLLLDEPMAGINPVLGTRLLDHMQQLRQERGVTFLFIEHDMEVVMNHSDRVVVMAEGRVIADGEPEEVRADKRVIDAYLGGAPVDTVAGEKPYG